MEENNPVSQDSKRPRDTKNKGMIKRYILTAWEFVKIIIIALIIVLPIRYFLFQPFIVRGDSMVPNFHTGDYLIVDEISYRFKQFERGDVVVLKFPLDTSQRFIKRVIGLPGETVEVKDGRVTIIKDGASTLLDERKYLPDPLMTNREISIALGKDK